MYEIKISNLNMSIENKKALIELIKKNINKTLIPGIIKKLLKFDLYSIEVYIYKDKANKIIINPIYIVDIVNDADYIKQASKSISQLLAVDMNQIEVAIENNVDDMEQIGCLEITSSKTVIYVN